MVDDLIMPIIGIIGKADFTNLFLPLSRAVTASNLVDARKQGGVLAYGDFITVVINFAIVAAALFLIVKGDQHDEEDRAARSGGRRRRRSPGGRAAHPDSRRAGQELTDHEALARARAYCHLRGGRARGP